jgi:cysteinyl-tRNA synthetase
MSLSPLRNVQFTNTSTRKKEVFRTLEPGKVKMYSCGPTVYGEIHIGNLRAALTSDLAYRFLRRAGFEVTYVRNYTDIDDKIIKRAQEEGVPMEVITRRYIEAAEQCYALAGMAEPTRKTRVTDHLPEIIEMIEAILKNGKAYVAGPSGGGPAREGQSSDVYFSIEDFPSYGALSGKSLEDLRAGARVEVNEIKRSPGDFALWKAAKSGEPAWDSPWGKGRPGWHIECSAMACKWLGPRMDLHHGGEDLVFPHHENEIAQSEAATGIAPYVGVWIHNAFLTFSSEKMSKSLGNVVLAKDFLAQFGGEVARMVFLGVHYRSTFDFNPEMVDHAVSTLARLYEAKRAAEELLERKIQTPDPMAEALWGGFFIDCERTRNSMLDHLANDLNTPGAFAELFGLVREWNRILAQGNARNTPAAILAAQEFIKVIEQEAGAVLGVGRMRGEAMLRHLSDIRALRSRNEGKTVLSDVEIEEWIRKRKDARSNKDFKTSDEIRDHLLKNGVEIKDSPSGTTWVRS